MPDCNGCAISEPAADFLGRCTALILATANCRTLMVEQLIAAGAGLDLKSNNGYTPMCRLQRLCDIRAGSRFVGRYTALILAARLGHTDITAALIFAGADVDVSNNAGYDQHRRGCMSAVV